MFFGNVPVEEVLELARKAGWYAHNQYPKSTEPDELAAHAIACLAERYKSLADKGAGYINTILRDEAKRHAATISYGKLVHYAPLKYTSKDMRALLSEAVWKSDDSNMPYSADMKTLTGYLKKTHVWVDLQDLQMSWDKLTAKQVQAIVAVYRDKGSPMGNMLCSRAIDALVRALNRRVNRAQEHSGGVGSREVTSSSVGQYTSKQQEERDTDTEVSDTPAWMLNGQHQSDPPGTHFDWNQGGE